jgi:hypothetical protein
MDINSLKYNNHVWKCGYNENYIFTKQIYVKFTTFVTKNLQYKLKYYFITTCKKWKKFVLCITDNCTELLQ